MSDTLVPIFDVSGLADDQSLRHDGADGSLFAVKQNGDVHVYFNRCPHQGTELDWLPGKFLDSHASHIQCATHGALFRIADGLCIAGPCIGQSLSRAPVKVRSGLVYPDSPQRPPEFSISQAD